MNETKIEWTDISWNPVTGCRECSPGCANCYAARLAATRLADHRRYQSLAVLGANGHAHWTGEVHLHHDKLLEPYRKRKGKKIFVCDMSDLFYEEVPENFIDKVFAVMACSPQHTFQVLTKRVERMAHYMERLADSLRHFIQAASAWGLNVPEEIPYPLPNVWLGTSIENQKTADARVPVLARIPAAVRFLSIEPLLGPIRLPHCTRSIHLGILGGESGDNCRACDIEWMRSLRDQLHGFGSAVFIKQLGSKPFATEYCDRPPVAGRTIQSADGKSWQTILNLRSRKGADTAEWPEDLRIREFPRAEVHHA